VVIRASIPAPAARLNLYPLPASFTVAEEEKGVDGFAPWVN